MSIIMPMYIHTPETDLTFKTESNRHTEREMDTFFTHSFIPSVVLTLNIRTFVQRNIHVYTPFPHTHFNCHS